MKDQLTIKELAERQILHEVNGYYVSNEGIRGKPNYHVWVPRDTHAVCDSAYGNISLAISRCNYLCNRH